MLTSKHKAELVRVVVSSNKGIAVERMMNWLNHEEATNEDMATYYVRAMSANLEPTTHAMIKTAREISKKTDDKKYMEGFSKYGFDHKIETLSGALRATDEDFMAIDSVMEKISIESAMTLGDFEEKIIAMLSDQNLKLMHKAWVLVLLWDFAIAVEEPSHEVH